MAHTTNARAGTGALDGIDIRAMSSRERSELRALALRAEAAAVERGESKLADAYHIDAEKLR